MNYIAIPGLKRDIDINRQVLGMVRHSNSADRIVEAVEKHFNITLEQMRSKNRRRLICYPRQVAMYLMYKRTALSLKDIGQFFGGRDHSTAIHSNQAIENLMTTESLIREEVEMILNKL